jgi:hypothetical protein
MITWLFYAGNKQKPFKIIKNENVRNTEQSSSQAYDCESD